MKKHTHDFPLLLREKGLRVTSARTSLLTALAKAKKPLAIHEIIPLLEGDSSQASIYRAMEELEKVNLIRSVDLKHAHAHYEFADPSSHHHHLICTNCSRVDDIAECVTKSAAEAILMRTPGWSSIESHSLEFYGTCSSCQRKNK